MMRRLIKRWGMLIGVGGPLLLFQQGCIDPDLFLRAGLQVFNEVTVFTLDNALVGLR